MLVRQNKISVTISMVGDLDREVSTEPGFRIEDVLRTINLFPDGFVAITEGHPVPMDTPVHDGMRIKLIKVASGG